MSVFFAKGASAADYGWQYNNQGNGSSNAAGSSSSYSKFSIVAASSGHITKLGVKININAGVGPNNVMMMLYDSSNNLLDYSTPRDVLGDGTGFKEFTLRNPVSVTSGTTYKVAWSAANGSVSWGYSSGTGTTYHSVTFTYTGTPQDPSSTGTNFSTFNFEFGIYIAA